MKARVLRQRFSMSFYGLAPASSVQSMKPQARVTSLQVRPGVFLAGQLSLIASEEMGSSAPDFMPE